LMSTTGGIPSTGEGFLAVYQQSPLTLGILALTIGYYLVYFTGLLAVAHGRGRVHA